MEAALPEIKETVRKVVGVIDAIGAESADVAERSTSSDSSGRGGAGRRLVVTRLAERLDDLADRLVVLADAYEDQLRRADRGMNRLIAQVEHDPNKLEDIADLAHSIHGMAMAAEHGLGQGESLAESLAAAWSTSRVLRPRTTRVCKALLHVASTWHVIRNWSDRLRAVEASSAAHTHGLDGKREQVFRSPAQPSSPPITESTT